MKKVFCVIVLSLALSLSVFGSAFAYTDENGQNDKVSLGAFLPEIPSKFYGGSYYEKGILHIKIVDTEQQGKDLLLSLQEFNIKASDVSALNAGTVFEGGAVYTYEELEEARFRIGSLDKDENGQYIERKIEFDGKPELIRWEVDIAENSLVIVAKEWNEASMKKMSELLGIEINHIIFQTANYTMYELEEALDKVIDAKLHKGLNVLETGLRSKENSIYVVAVKWDDELKEKVMEISGLKRENIIFIIYGGEIDNSDLVYDTNDYLVGKIKEIFKKQ